MLWVSVRLTVRHGRWDDAVSEFEAVLALLREIGLPREEALLSYDCGRSHERRGEAERARSRLEAALAIFHRLVAGADVERTERALVEIGPS